jgi:hypothetical protein
MREERAPSAGYEGESFIVPLKIHTTGFSQLPPVQNVCRPPLALYARAMSAGKPTDTVSKLCPNCGLCCNGMLFADVELRASDDTGRFTRPEKPLQKKLVKTMKCPNICLRWLNWTHFMKTQKISMMGLTVSACLLAGMALKVPAQGVSVYDSFDPGGALDTTGFVQLANTPEYVGQIFTPAISGTLDHAVLGLTTEIGEPFIVSVELHTWTYTVSNYGYIDTTPLESWNLGFSNVLTGVTGVPLTVPSSVKPLLVAGQSYVFVVAIVSAPLNDGLLWCGAPYPHPEPNGGYCYTYGGTNYFWTIGEVTLKVNVNPAPAPLSITGISLAGTNLVLKGSNGVSGTTNYLLMTTNLALPKNQWTRIATNVLSATGNFTFTATNAVDLNAPQRFYTLQQ